MFVNALIVAASVYLVGHWLAGACTAVLMLVWHVTPREEGPPVLPLALTAQWVQVTSGVYYSGLTGRTLEATEGSDYRPMVLIGLVCIVALAIGLRAGAELIRRRMPMPDFAPEYVADWKTLVLVYIGGVVVTGVMQELAWRYPTLTQAILALTYARLALLYLLLRRLARPSLRWDLILVILAFEVGLGFTGYFSGFKEPMLLAGLAVLEVFEPRRVTHWATAVALAVLLAVASVMWMGVRTQFRQDFDDEVFAASRSVRLQRIQALSTDWFRQSSERVSEDLDRLVDRAWAIYYPALAIARVPDVLPHTDGHMMKAALIHLLTPRIVYPNKPDLPSDSELVRKYAGVWVAGPEQNTSIAFGYAAESYVDFGLPRMFIPVLVFGIVMGIAYEAFSRGVRHRELAVSVVTAMFWMNLYLFERSWAKTLGLSLTMMVYLGGLTFLVDRWLMLRADERQHDSTWPSDDPQYVDATR
jgi:hypothetical protein